MKIRLLFLLALSSFAFGQGTIVPPQTAFKVVNGVTSPIANATITVCAAQTPGVPCSPVLSNALFQDAALTEPLENPFTADSTGNYQFAIAAGTYTVTVSAAGFSGYSYQITVGGSGGSSGGGSGPVLETIPNCPIGGTVLHGPAQLSSQTTNGVLTACVIGTPVGSTSAIGLVSAGGGTSGNASIAYQGFSQCVFTGQTQINDIAVPSTTVANQCDDVGAFRIAGVQSLGRISSVNTGSGTLATVNLFTGDVVGAGSSGGNGTVNNGPQSACPFYSSPGSSNQISPDANCVTDGAGNFAGFKSIVVGTPGTLGAVGLGFGAAPALPASGVGNLFANTANGLLTCATANGIDCIYDWMDANKFGGFADGTTAHTITQNDINNNTQWRGCGVVNTSGTSVTWVSGATFYPDLNSYAETVNIGGANYAVAGIGTITGGSATSLTLGSSAGTQTGVRWCEYAVGDQWDYVALQEAIFAALGAPGAEHSNTNARLNKEIVIPNGSWMLNKPLNITHGVGVHLKGQMRYGVTLFAITNNTPLLVTNGFSESRIEGIFFRPTGTATATTNALVEISWDGSSTNWTQALQGDTFQDNVFSAEGAAWQIGLRLGGGGFQASENLFLNDHWFWFTSECLVLSNANALQNTIEGGNFQNCSGDGIHVTAGSIYVHSTGFQDGRANSSPAQSGFDVNILNSSNDTDSVEDSRTESQNFVSTTNTPKIWIVGNHQAPAATNWQANHTFTSPGTTLFKPPVGSTQQIGGFFTTPSTCTTGASEPTWTYTTVVDGGCTWTYSPATFISGPTQGTIMGNSIEGGAITNVSIGSSNGNQVVIFNNVWSRRDWLSPNGQNPSSPQNNAVFECLNVVFAGGGFNSGGGGATWRVGGVSDGRLYSGISHCAFGAQPLLFSAGQPGTPGWDVGIGPGEPPNGTTGTPVLAVLGSQPGVGLGQNPVLGRQYAVGTNAASTNQDIASGQGTGNVTPALTQIFGPVAQPSGTTPQPLVQRLVVNDTKQLTSGSATTLVSSTIAADQRAGGKIDYFIEATDTTNHHNCALAGTIMYTAENTAATVVANVSAIGTPATACDGANALTVTWAQSAATPSLTQMTPTLTGFTATQFQIVYSVENYGQGQTAPTF